MFEGEVEADADEGGAEDDGDDLGLECGAVPWVEGEEGAGCVAFGSVSCLTGWDERRRKTNQHTPKYTPL